MRLKLVIPGSAYDRQQRNAPAPEVEAEEELPAEAGDPNAGVGALALPAARYANGSPSPSFYNWGLVVGISWSAEELADVVRSPRLGKPGKRAVKVMHGRRGRKLQPELGLKPAWQTSRSRRLN